MSSSSYGGSGLVGTSAYAQMLGFIELVEVFGARGAPGLLYYDSEGIPTIGYGFALTLRNGVANSNVMAAVLDGLLPQGETYAPGHTNDNVFVAASKGPSPLTESEVSSYFDWLVYTYGKESVTSAADLQGLLTDALQQFYAGNGSELYNSGIYLLPVTGVPSTDISFSFSPYDRTNAEQVLSNLLAGASINEVGQGTSSKVPSNYLTINGYSPGLYGILQGLGRIDGSGNVDGAPADSPQWAALVASYYNGLPSDTTGGLADDDPAETWYKLRYSTKSPSRGYLEAQLFGLNGGSTADPTTLAYQDYEMLTEHRGAVLDFEAANGIDPNSLTPSPRFGAGIRNAFGEIEAGRTQTDGPSYYPGPLAELPAALLSVTDIGELSLSQIFNPEADLIINELNSTYGSILPQIVNASEGAGGLSGFAVSSTNILVAPSQTDIQNGFATQAQLAVDLGADSGNHILLGTGAGDYLEGGSGNDLLVAGSGDETLQAGAGSDTLIGGSGNDVLGGGVGKDVFDCLLSPGTTNFIVDQSGNGSIYINQALFVPAGALSPTVSYQWTDGTNTYKFTPGNEIPASDLPTFQAGLQVSQLSELSPWIGELTITGPGVNGGTLKIVGFDLGQAEESSNGFLGIKIPYELNVTAGATIGTDPPATFPAGSEQSHTFSVAVPASQAQTVTFTLSGASPSDFDVQVGDTTQQLNADGTFTVTLPAGATSVSFGLIDVTQNDGTSDIAGGATLTLTASVTNPTDPNGSPIQSSPLSITYTPEPQNTAAGPQGGDPIAGKYDSVTGITTYQGDGGDDFISAGQGPNRILAHNSGGDSIVGGSGRNTIDGGSGNDAIGVNGMPDLVLLVERFNARNDVTGADLIRTQGTDSRTTDANAITFRSLPLGICFVRAIAALLLGLATVVFPLCSAVQAANLAPCIRKYVRFDGSEPLQFDRVTGLPGTRLYIHASYPKSCNSSTSSCAGGHAYLLPGDTVAIGKTCGHWTYMQYIGVSRITKGWVDGSRLNFLKKVGTGEGTPLFTLTRGRGKPVCEAYLQRLNVTQSNYCTMPESDAIPGFSVLHRVPLRASTMVKMSGRVFEWWEHPDPHLNGSWNGTLRAVGTVMEAWRYNPPIDVNNDGRPDNIIVWQGYGLQDGVTFCGEPFTRFYNWGYRPRRLPLIMSSRSHIDAEETALVFGRPGRGLNRGRRLALGEMPFKPVGHFITPFKYRGVTYFSTFFDVTGDYRGLRKNQPKLANVLGVLLRRDHNTREVCEYKMAGSDYPPENAQPSGLISAQE